MDLLSSLRKHTPLAADAAPPASTGPFREGWEAFERGEPISNNPYGGYSLKIGSKSNGPDAVAWEIGYKRAKAAKGAS